MSIEELYKGIVEGKIKNAFIVNSIKEIQCGNDTVDREILIDIIYKIWDGIKEEEKNNSVCHISNLLNAENTIVDFFGDVFGEDVVNGQICVLRYGRCMTKEQAYYYRHGHYPDQQTEPQQELIDLLPESLKTDEVITVFQRAIDAKLIMNTPNGLEWTETKQLLAYFATRVSEKFSLSNMTDKDGKKTTAWKPFETLFRMNGLSMAKQNWMRLNTLFEPNGFEKVDALF